jgi:uncharacterized OB-fold protein
MKTSIAPTIQQKIQIPYNYSAGPAMTKFLRGLKDKVIYASLCASCGKRSVPPLSFCGRCWQPTDSYVPVEQVGAVESFVAPAAFPAELSSHPSGAGFYGLIRLQDCSTNLVHLVQAKPGSSLQIGAVVRPVWKEERTASIMDIAYFAAE